MHKNSSAPSKNTTLWHYLGTKCLDLWRENNNTPGVLINKIWYTTLICQKSVKAWSLKCVMKGTAQFYIEILQAGYQLYENLTSYWIFNNNQLVNWKSRYVSCTVPIHIAAVYKTELMGSGIWTWYQPGKQMRTVHVPVIISGRQ